MGTGRSEAKSLRPAPAGIYGGPRPSLRNKKFYVVIWAKLALFNTVDFSAYFSNFLHVALKMELLVR